MSFFQRLGTAKKAANGVESLQLINAEGMFDVTGLEAFAKTINLAECGLSYAVVAIMGPQSSGKSTLLNHLFSTSFVEMDAFSGRNQTTQGVWLARASGINPCTIVMDLEGTDGRERGEDDTAFEKQSALFALAVADIVLINMWCHDIGREQAANKPLLKIVFQVMVRLFTPRKTTLLFVIRDKTRTPMEVLEPILCEDVQKIWESAPKPSSFEGMDLSDCFNVQVTALSNYEDKPEVFKDQVADLRERFNNSVSPGGLAGDRRAVVPGTAFPVSIRSIWDTIRENKDLDLPAHKVMVATVRCEEIANEKLMEFVENQEWMEINEKAKASAVPGFGGNVNTLLNKLISEYDLEVSYFDENVRTSKRNYLIQKSLETIYPAHQQILSHHRLGAMNKFRQDMRVWAQSSSEEIGFADATRQTSKSALSNFDGGVADATISFAEWDSRKLRDKLRRDIDAHAAAVKNEKVGAIVADAEKHLQQNVGEPTGALLETATPDTWPAIRDLLGHEVKLCQSALLALLAGYELDTSSEKAVLDNLAGYGRSVVENEARKEAGQALLRMKDRFTTSFSHDAESLPRLWSDKDDVRAIARDARTSSVKGLSVLAAIRLDDGKTDQIEPALVTLLADHHEGSQSKSLGIISGGDNSAITPSNPLAASSWEGVSTHYTLLTPTQCKSIWRQFKAETDFAISQALAAQEARRNSKSWLPPPWAIGAMIVLGFNEFMALLRNPLYLLIFFVFYLFGRALWVQLNLSQEFRHGIIPGILSVSNKVVPTIMNLLTKLAEEGSAAARLKSSSSSSTTCAPLNRSRSSTSSRGSTDITDMHDFVAQEHLDYGHVIDSDSSVRNRQHTKSMELEN